MIAANIPTQRVSLATLVDDLQASKRSREAIAALPAGWRRDKALSRADADIAWIEKEIANLKK